MHLSLVVIRIRSWVLLRGELLDAKKSSLVNGEGRTTVPLNYQTAAEHELCIRVAVRSGASG
jgi:hypothetical protein